jgi:RNA polymerase sigma-70 factor (ECF subfamily)
VAVSRAAAAACAGDAAEALRRLDAVAGACRDYQPYWAVRADALARTAAPAATVDAAYATAIGLSADAAVRAYLESRRATWRPA